MTLNLLTPQTAARHLKVAVQTVRRWCARSGPDRLQQATRVGGQWLIFMSTDQLKAWAEQEATRVAGVRQATAARARAARANGRGNRHG